MSGADAGRGGAKWFVAGCVVMVVMGLMHLAAELKGPIPAANDDQATLFRLLGQCRFELPGATRTMQQLMEGFGMFFTCASIAMAAIGLAALPLVRSGKRLQVVYAASCAVFLVISLVYWFLIPTSILAVTTTLFVVSALRDGPRRAIA